MKPQFEQLALNKLKDRNIRLAVYNGRLPDLISTHSYVKEEGPISLMGKTLTASVGDDKPNTYALREDGEAFISGGEAGEGLDAYYKHLDTFGAVVAATAVDLRNCLLFILSPSTKVQAL